MVGHRWSSLIYLLLKLWDLFSIFFHWLVVLDLLRPHMIRLGTLNPTRHIITILILYSQHLLSLFIVLITFFHCKGSLWHALKNTYFDFVLFKVVTFFWFKLDKLWCAATDLGLWISLDLFFEVFRCFSVLKFLDGRAASLVLRKDWAFLVCGSANSNLIRMVGLPFQEKVGRVVEDWLVIRPTIFNHWGDHWFICVENTSWF